MNLNRKTVRVYKKCQNLLKHISYNFFFEKPFKRIYLQAKIFNFQKIASKRFREDLYIPGCR